jgi:anti-sigma factor RsiW
MTRRTPSCDWVRARLPLEIGRDDGDLAARERAKLRRHLADCESCRRDRAALADAMAVLSAVSEISPVEPHAPSLWPALELRIRERELSRERPATSSFRLPASLSFSLDGCRDLLSEPGTWTRPGIALGGLAAALLCGVIALQADRALSRSRPEAAPEARPVAPAVAGTAAPADDWDFDTDSEIAVAAEDGGNRWQWHSSPRAFAASSENDGGDESRSALPGPLAQADIHPTPRQSSAGGSENSGSGTSVTTSNASSKYDFDLERGTPMPPDSRDAKAAY